MDADTTPGGRTQPTRPPDGRLRRLVFGARDAIRRAGTAPAHRDDVRHHQYDRRVRRHRALGDVRVYAVSRGTAGVTVLPLALFPFAEGYLALAALAVGQGTRRGIIPVNNTYILKALPDDVQGGAWGFLRSIFLLLASTGSLFVGVMADSGYFDEAFFALAAISAVPMVLYVVLFWSPLGRAQV